jgi:uncharacterized protein (DUF1697 family)
VTEQNIKVADHHQSLSVNRQQGKTYIFTGNLVFKSPLHFLQIFTGENTTFYKKMVPASVYQ